MGAKFYSGDEDFGAICICAVRYAIGRATYMPGVVIRFIRGHIEELSNKDLYVMSRDIKEAAFGGDDLNSDDWMAFYLKIAMELKRRAGVLD